MTNGSPKQTIALPAEGFAVLIRSAAQAIVDEMGRPASAVRAKWLHDQIGVLDELVGKFAHHGMETP